MPHITDLSGDRVSKLTLNGEVPLARQCWPEVLIDDSDSFSLVTGKIDCCTSCGRTVTCSKTTSIASNSPSASLLNDAKWRVDRELLVRTAAFEEGGDCVSTTDHCLATQGGRRPGKTKPRLPIADAQIVVVESPVAEPCRAISAVRCVDRPGEQPKVDDPIVDLPKWSMILEPHSEIQRQRVCHAPIILNVGGVDIATIPKDRRRDICIPQSASTCAPKIEIRQPRA